MVKNSECIFCKIANKEIPAKMIVENDYAVAFLDADPVTDGHTLIIPKLHCENFSTCNDKYMVGVSLLAKEIAKKLILSPLKPWGFNFLSNEQSIAGQEVKHFHLHVIPKYEKGIGFNIGKVQNIVKPKNIRNINETFDILKKSKYIIE